MTDAIAAYFNDMNSSLSNLLYELINAVAEASQQKLGFISIAANNRLILSVNSFQFTHFLSYSH